MMNRLLLLLLVFSLVSCVRPNYAFRERARVYSDQVCSEIYSRPKLDWQVRHKEPVIATKPIVKPVSPKPAPLAAPIKPKPLVSAPIKTETVVKKEGLIVLDAGHGGKDTGALGKKNSYVEKNLTLQTVNMLKTYLNQMGYEVRLTRHEDKFVPLEERALFANKHKAALFVSVHYNFCDDSDVKGIEVYYHKDDKHPYAKRLTESRKLGEQVLSKIVKNTGAHSRGVRKANFAVIRETNMPAILIEGGFLSNPDERKKILDPAYLRQYALAIATGVDTYLASKK